MKRFSRTLSWLLCIAMVVAMVPVAASAATEAVTTSAINFNDFVANATARCTVDITNEGSTVRLATTNQGNDTYTFQGTNANIDHSKDLILTQTLNAADLVQGGDPKFTDYTAWLDSENTKNDARNSIQFWMSDAAHASEGKAVIFSLGRLYNSNWNSYNGNVPLILRVHQNGSKVHTDIDLGLYLSTEFELTIRWNTNDSVEVYVDGVHKGTVANATVNTTTLFGNNTIGFHYTTNGAKASDVTVSNMSLKAVDASVMNFNNFALTKQGAPVVTVEDMGSTVSASLTSGSTNEMIMTTTNNQVDHSKDMILTQTIDPINLSVQGTPRFVDYTEWMGSNVMRNAYNFWISDTAHASEGAAVVFSVGRMYVDGNTDGSKMMLRVHQNGNNVNTDIALKDYSTDPFELSIRWNADDSVEIYVDGVLKGTVEKATVNTTTLFGDDIVGIRYYTHNANGAPGVFAVSNMSLKAVDPSIMNFNNFTLTTQGSPFVTVENMGNTVRGAFTSGSTNEMIMTTTDTRVDHSKDMILTQTINPINLSALGNPDFGNFSSWHTTPDDMRNAYNFWISDTAAASDGTAVVCSVGALFNSGLGNTSAASKMILRVHLNGSKAHTDIVLKDYSTDAFELSIRWNTDDSVDIYVDGAFKGTVEHATVNTTTLFGSDTVGLHYYTNNANGVKGQFAVSNMSLKAEEPEAPIAFTGVNVQLNSILSIKFYASAGNTVKVSVPGVGEQTLTSEDGVYVAKVFAQDMMKDITATLIDAEGNECESKTFNLETYVGQLTGKDAAMGEATLTYCQYAAIYKGNFDGEANELAAIPEGAFTGYDYPTSGPAGCSVNAYLEEACELRLYLPDNGYTVTINGTAAELASNICSTEKILPQNYGVAYTFSVLKDGSVEPEEVTLTVLAYLNKCLNGGVTLTDNQRNLMTAMYHYYAAATAYLSAS